MLAACNCHLAPTFHKRIVHDIHPSFSLLAVLDNVWRSTDMNTPSSDHAILNSQIVGRSESVCRRSATGALILWLLSFIHTGPMFTSGT